MKTNDGGKEFQIVSRRSTGQIRWPPSNQATDKPKSTRQDRDYWLAVLPARLGSVGALSAIRLCGCIGCH